jgi:hypothetical protein
MLTQSPSNPKTSGDPSNHPRIPRPPETHPITLESRGRDTWAQKSWWHFSPGGRFFSHMYNEKIFIDFGPMGLVPDLTRSALCPPGIHKGYLNVPGGKTPLKWRSRVARPSRSDVFPPGTFTVPLWIPGGKKWLADVASDLMGPGLNLWSHGTWWDQTSMNIFSLYM